MYFEDQNPKVTYSVPIRIRAGKDEKLFISSVFAIFFGVVILSDGPARGGIWFFLALIWVMLWGTVGTISMIRAMRREKKFTLSYEEIEELLALKQSQFKSQKLEANESHE